MHRCVYLLFLMLAVSSCQARTITFGINLALNQTEAGFYGPQQIQALQGLEIWRDWWNALPVELRTTQWGEAIDVQLHVETWSEYGQGFSPEAEASMFQIYYKMWQNSSIDFFFGPIAFEGVATRQYMYQELNVSIMVYAVDSSESFYKIPGSFGAPTANKLTMTSWLPYLRVAGAKTVAILQVVDKVYQNELCQGIADNAAANGLNVVYYENMPFTWEDDGAIDGIGNRSAIWSQALDDIIALDPDAVAVCDYGFGTEFALSYIRSKNWSPKSFATSPQYGTFSDPSLLDYVVMPAQYSYEARYPAQLNFTDSAGFNALAQSKYGVNATIVMAEATLSGMMWTNALVNSKSMNAADLITAMRDAQIDSFMGLSSMDVKNRQTMLALVIQLLKSGQQTNVVGPAQASVNSFIYPMPTWEQRVFTSKWGSPVEIVGVVIIAIGSLVSLVCLSVLIKYWDHPVMKAASPTFCLLMIFGNLFMYGSLVVWMPSLVSDTICMLRAWLLPMAFMIMFGAVIAKTQRIYRLYKTPGVNILVITDLVVLGWASFIVLGQIVVSIFMSIPFTTSLGSELYLVDEYRVSLNYNVCTFPVHVKVLLGINIAYAVGWLAWGSYLALGVRKIQNKKFNESKEILFSIYNVVFFAAIVLVIQLAVGNSARDLTFMITAVCCLLGGGLTVGTLFGFKYYAIRFANLNLAASRSGSSGYTTSGSAYGSYGKSESEWSLNDLDARIAHLKTIRDEKANGVIAKPSSIKRHKSSKSSAL